jgi:hypothetical protein
MLESCQQKSSSQPSSPQASVVLPAVPVEAGLGAFATPIDDAGQKVTGKTAVEGREKNKNRTQYKGQQETGGSTVRGGSANASGSTLRGT